MSVIVMVAVLVTMLSTTVFAASSPTTAKQVKDSMQKAADWMAGNMYDNLDGESAITITNQAAGPVFLLAKTGSTSDNVVKFENMFLAALKENIDDNGAVISGASSWGPYEEYATYANVISALLALGKDPKNFEGNNVVQMFATWLNSSQDNTITYENYSPYNLLLEKAVLGYYKDFDAKFASEYAIADSAIMSTFVKTSTTSTDYVTNKNVSKYDTANVLSSFTINTDYYYKDNGYLKVKNTDIVSALNGSSSIYAPKFGMENDMYGGEPLLTVQAPFDGTGFFNAGFSADTDAKMSVALLSSKDSTTEYATRDTVNPATISPKDAIAIALKNITDATDATGLVDGFGFGGNANSTGLSLAAMSAFGKTSEASLMFNGLVTLQNADGGFVYDGKKTDSDARATKDALEGVTAYFFCITGLGSIYDLDANVSELAEAAETNQVEMTTPANATWVASNGDWFTVSSPLPLSELLDIQIDGKSVFGDYISTDENGVMTFAAIGGGTIRVWEGSTYVSFSPEFMSTLGNGEHTVRIQSTTGFAESTFTVQAATPSTGDAANIAMYIAIAGVGAAVVTAAFVSKKRSSDCE